MHIDLRNEQRQRLFTVHIDPKSPPMVVRPPSGQGPAVHLSWDRVMDDKHHMRRCPVCGCPDLFARKPVPQLTIFSLVLLAGIGAMVLYGFGQVAWAVVVLAVVLTVDVAIYLFARKVLVCYRCHSEYSRMPIRRDHPAWENTLGERYRFVAPQTAEPETTEPIANSRGEDAP